MRKSIVVLLLCMCAATVTWADPYRSYNEVCIVEKQEGNYQFFKGGNKELSQRSQEVFENNPNQFEWFFTENGKIVAKVYPALRDAFVQAPDNLFKQSVKACQLTADNQRAAATVSYRYKSQDKVCACLWEKGTLNCAITVDSLRRIPYEKWAMFFETQGHPSVMVGMVPPVLTQAWDQVPQDFVQRITPCENNTTNEDLAVRYAPLVHQLYQF